MSFYALLFIFGGLGVIIRYLVGKGIPSFLGFPISTLLVNIVGAFFIGLFFSWTQRIEQNSDWKWAVMIGLLGAMTTFSSFSLETMKLFQNGMASKAVLNIFLNNSLSLLFCWLGWSLGRYPA